MQPLCQVFLVFEQGTKLRSHCKMCESCCGNCVTSASGLVEALVRQSDKHAVAAACAKSEIVSWISLVSEHVDHVNCFV